MTQTLNNSGVTLAIEGMDTERKISASGTGPVFSVSAGKLVLNSNISIESVTVSSADSLMLSGGPYIETLNLAANTNVSISARWTGSVAILNLNGANTDWLNKQVIKATAGPALNGRDIERFTLGNFGGGSGNKITGTLPTDIDNPTPNYMIGLSGTELGYLSLPVPPVLRGTRWSSPANHSISRKYQLLTFTGQEIHVVNFPGQTAPQEDWIEISLDAVIYGYELISANRYRIFGEYYAVRMRELIINIFSPAVGIPFEMVFGDEDAAFDGEFTISADGNTINMDQNYTKY